MSVVMKKRHIKQIADVIWCGKRYLIPLKVIEKYKSPASNHGLVAVEDVFAELLKKHGEHGALLKGLRAKEGLTQLEFAKMIRISQSNLSAMENGKRPIGKELAKRIAKKFKIDYRLFL